MRRNKISVGGVLAAAAGFVGGGLLCGTAVGLYWFRSLTRLAGALLGNPSVPGGVGLYRRATGALDEIAIAAFVGGVSGAVLLFLLHRVVTSRGR